MTGLVQWLGDMQNSKVVALLLFFSLFCLILVYLYSNKKRSQRLESYKHIPLQEDDDDEVADENRKVNRNE